MICSTRYRNCYYLYVLGLHTWVSGAGDRLFSLTLMTEYKSLKALVHLFGGTRRDCTCRWNGVKESVFYFVSEAVRGILRQLNSRVDIFARLFIFLASYIEFSVLV